MTAYEVILRKRRGEELEPREIEFMVRGLLDGRVLVTGGEDAASLSIRDVEAYDPR